MSEIIWVETLGPNGREMIPVEVEEVASKPEEIGEEPEEVIEVASVVKEADDTPAPKRRRKKKEAE